MEQYKHDKLEQLVKVVAISDLRKFATILDDSLISFINDILRKENIREGIEKLTPSPEKESDYEQKLFTYFIASINSQIKSLKLEPDLDPRLKERLNHFEETLQKFEAEK